MAFQCYNPHWRANPNYNDMPQPPPHPISKLEPEPDPAPAEPNPNASSEKRGLGEGDDSNPYYAPRRRLLSNNPLKPPPPEESWRRPANGPPRAEYMCSNEYMESVGIVPARPQWERKFTPENPWQRKPPVRNKTPEEKKKPGRRPNPEPMTPPADEPGPSPWFGRREERGRSRCILVPLCQVAGWLPHATQRPYFEFYSRVLMNMRQRIVICQVENESI